MDDYNFWQDFFDTYQSLSDWMKFAWLVVPPAFALGVLALVMRYRLAAKRIVDLPAGSLAYIVIPDEKGTLRIYSHDDPDELTASGPVGGLLPLPGAQPHKLAKPRLPDV